MRHGQRAVARQGHRFPEWECRGTAMPGSTGWEHGPGPCRRSPKGGASVTPAGVTPSCFKASWALMPPQGREMAETTEACGGHEIRSTQSRGAANGAVEDRLPPPASHTRAGPGPSARSHVLRTAVPWGDRKGKGQRLRPSESRAFPDGAAGNTKRGLLTVLV